MVSVFLQESQTEFAKHIPPGPLVVVFLEHTVNSTVYSTSPSLLSNSSANKEKLLKGICQAISPLKQMTYNCSGEELPSQSYVRLRA